jgi:outer membrane protein assembly factor BamD (BamD/ComL family)
MRIWRIRIPVQLLVIAVPFFAAAAEQEVFVEAEGPRPWYTLLRPARPDPASQLAYARELRDRGATRRARRHYRALVASWPSSPEAPIAQFELARMLDEAGAAEEAFEAYQILMERYAGRFPFQEVFRRQLQIADELMKRRRFRFLFGGFTSPDRAIPLLEKAASNAPTHEDAGRARLLLGKAHRQMGEIAAAAEAFALVAQQFPDLPLGVEAEFLHAECLAEKCRRARGDLHVLDEAWMAFDRFVRNHPDSPFTATAREHRERLQRLRAEAAWEKAYFYDRQGSKEAAISAYERLLDEFPDADRAPAARARLEILRGQKEKQRSSP